MTRKVYITGRGLISPAGLSLSAHWSQLQSGRHALSWSQDYWAGLLPESVLARLRELRQLKPLRFLDDVILLGIIATEHAVYESGADVRAAAVCFGSSRGMAELWERSYDDYKGGERLKPYTSPVTTLGGLASGISRYIGAHGFSVATSAACATSMQAFGVGYSLLKSGMTKTAIIGGSESALTPFTIGMLQAAQVYNKSNRDAAFPCRPFHHDRNGMVLSSGAAAIVLETEPKNFPLAEVLGFGSYTEPGTLTGIDKTGQGLSQVLTDLIAAAQLTSKDIDFIVVHGAGTVKGDSAELLAIQQVFGEKIPVLLAHKWALGHLLGAAGAASLALGVEHLIQSTATPHPFAAPGSLLARVAPARPFNQGMIVSLGFGGFTSATLIRNCNLPIS